jgi:TonB family protein
MRRIAVATLAIRIPGSLMVIAAAAVVAFAQSAARYQPATVTSAGNIPYPPNSRNSGMVTLDVSVDSSGAVQQVTAPRDLPPFTKTAENALNGWSFSGARKAGQLAPGVVRVNVIFNPFNPSNVSIPAPPLPPPRNNVAGQSGSFQLPDVKSANYAAYPPNTVASGTVVLDVRVSRDGGVGDVKVLQGSGPLSDAPVNAVKSWTFAPARYQGKPVAAHTVVAFVFVQPEVGTQ